MSKWPVLYGTSLPFTDREGVKDVLGLPVRKGFDDYMVASGVPSGQRGTTDDPDGDGVKNIVEFTLAGQHPMQRTADAGLQPQAVGGNATLTWMPRFDSNIYAAISCEQSPPQRLDRCAGRAAHGESRQHRHRDRASASLRTALSAAESDCHSLTAHAAETEEKVWHAGWISGQSCLNDPELPCARFLSSSPVFSRYSTPPPLNHQRMPGRESSRTSTATSRSRRRQRKKPGPRVPQHCARRC